ncbi:MAG: TatD family hydrolase [Candidatus Omnitrophica bacterium]|nr:TatD family hydrolase [Candidatus Omnitrophota bacterium]
MLQDTHIHLHDIKINADIERFLGAVKSAGFKRLFAVAITPQDWPIIKSLSEQNPEIVPFFGIHPWFSDMATEGWQEKIKPYLGLSHAGVGETGLDKARKNIDFTFQEKIFKDHLNLAKDTGKPFMVHSVRAWGEALLLIKKHGDGLPFLAHSFNGSREVMLEIVKLGGYVSVSVKQFLKPDEAFKDVFTAIPHDRILIETDFPYQVKWTTPQDYIHAIQSGYETAALWRHEPIENFIKAVYDNGTVFTDRTLTR